MTANSGALAANAALCLASRKVITNAVVASIGRRVEIISMFVHLSIHVHTAWVLLLTVKLGAVGGTTVLTGAMVATLT